MKIFIKNLKPNNYNLNIHNTSHEQIWNKDNTSTSPKKINNKNSYISVNKI